MRNLTKKDFEAYEAGDKKAGARVDTVVKELHALDPSRPYRTAYREAREAAFARAEPPAPEPPAPEPPAPEAPPLAEHDVAPVVAPVPPVAEAPELEREEPDVLLPPGSRRVVKPRR